MQLERASVVSVQRRSAAPQPAPAGQRASTGYEQPADTNTGNVSSNTTGAAGNGVAYEQPTQGTNASGIQPALW